MYTFGFNYYRITPFVGVHHTNERDGISNCKDSLWSFVYTGSNPELQTTGTGSRPSWEMGILNNCLHVTLLPGEQNISVLIVGFTCWTTPLVSIPGLLPPYGILLRTNIIMRVTFEPCAVVRRQKALMIVIT